jgi:RHS repeat-associated protein
MHLYKRLIAIVIIATNVCVLHAQDNFLKDFSPVAPNAASLGKYGDIPVSAHTGVPEINVPIYTVTDGSVSLPVGLSYHASGIRVTETASWAGLGWSLNAGGMITRTVQNAPDEGNVVVNQQTGYYKNFGHSIASGDNCQELIDAGNGLVDTEPDVFTFNVNGIAGKFVFDNARVIRQFPESDITIQVFTSTNSNGYIFFDGWIITDLQGIRYHFARTPDNPVTAMDFIETTATSTNFSIAGSWIETRSSWYLSKIESADRFDAITLNYNAEKYSFWSMGTNVNNGSGIGACPNMVAGPPLQTRITGKRLSSIIASNSSMHFTGAPSPREDLSNYLYCPSATTCTLNTEALSLKSIELRAKDGTTCLRKWDLNTSYITASATTNVATNQLPPNNDQTDRKRLILNSITESDCIATTNNKVHSFEYYDQSAMPRRFSYAQDHWGYYNASTSNTFMPGWPYAKTPCNTNCLYPNYAYKCTPNTMANRESSFPAMRSCALSKINYPTGGSTTFEFEGNSIWTTDTTCTEANIGTSPWSTSAGSCTGQNTFWGTETYTATQISTGLIEIKSETFSGCTYNTSATLSFHSIPGGPAVATLSISGSPGGPAFGYARLNNINGVSLVAGVAYQVKLVCGGGIASAKVYSFTRTTVNLNKTIGGLRIKTITNFDGLNTSNNIVKNYRYQDHANPAQSSGKLIDKPVYVAVFYGNSGQYLCGGNNCCSFVDNSFTGTSCPPSSPVVYASFSTNSMQPMQTTLGSHIGYRTVEVSQTGNGKHRMYFYMGSYATTWTPSGYPLTPPPFDPLLGRLEEEEFWTESGQVIGEKLYEYTNLSVAIGGTNAVIKVGKYGGATMHRLYNIQTGYALPSVVKERQYNTDGSYVEKIITSSYNLTGPAPDWQFNKITEDVVNSDGTTYRTKFKYPKDFTCPKTFGPCDETNTSTSPEVKVILAMQKRNMVLPIEITTWLKKSSWSSFQLTGATYNEYTAIGGNFNNIKLKAIHQVRPGSPLATFTEANISTSAIFTYSNTLYNQEYNFNFSATHGKPLSQWKQHDPAKQQYIWGHNQELPIAKIINAEANEVAFTSFEEQTNGISQGNWTLTGTIDGWRTNTGDFVTGRTGFNLSPARTCTVSQLPAGKYIISCWHKNGSILVNGTIISTATSAWKLAETEITLSNASNTVTVSSGGADALQVVDELRLIPSDALMNTFSMDDRNQLLLSMSDANNVNTHYDYDSRMRLLSTRDQDRNILETYEYNIQQAGTALNDFKTRRVLVSGQTTTTQVNALSNPNVLRSFQYMDGLGRPIQSIEVAASPAQADIVGYNQYDTYGRSPKSFIPYTVAGNNGNFRTNAAAEQITFANSFGAGGYGYTETKYEPSPLNRAIEQSAPGATWRIGNGKTAESLYRGNTAAEAVRDFTNGTNYPANALLVTETIDENEIKTFTYLDKIGRSVMVRQQMPVTLSGTEDNDFARTYTIYDDFGRIDAVIPPEAAKKMKTTANWAYTTSTFASMIYRYAYDSRGRLISKTIPSNGTSTITYDRLDRPVLTKDAKNTKLFTKYDILSRPVLIGRYFGTATPQSSDPLFEISNTTAPHYYSALAFPTANFDVYKVMYYDDYDVDNNNSVSTGEAYTNPTEAPYETSAFLRIRGLIAAIKTAVITGAGDVPPSVFLTTRMYYDKEFSVIQVNKQNQLGGSDITSTAYDFANRPTQTRRDHTATPPGGALNTLTIRENYVYDHASRPLYVIHQVNNQKKEIISALQYDELGRVIEKNLHASGYTNNSVPPTAAAFDYLQSIDFSYNIRGWLTAINNPTSCGIQAGDFKVDAFRMSMEYESGVNPQYNGNIAAIQWNTHLNGTCGARQLYRFSYDGANRLTAATHYERSGSLWTNPSKYNESNITYDLNGNLKTYNRQGLISGTSTFGTIDNLTYTYGDADRPDRLTNVNDSGNSAKGFKFTSGAAAYQYDANGNMTQDNHKNLSIVYNFLNLPTTFTLSGGVISMSYTADGEKLSKTVGGVTKNYVSGIEYNGAALESIYHSEGRCTLITSTFRYEYNLKDHLGNTRVRFQADGSNVSFQEESHYYPFGLLMEGNSAAPASSNAYKYNGKELNTDLGLNLSDYGARWYDAALGRWWSVDPMGEAYASSSGYNYVLNNPLIFVDPDGMSVRNSWYDSFLSSVEDNNQTAESERAAERASLDEVGRTAVRATGSLLGPDNGYERVINPKTGKPELKPLSNEGGNAYDVIYEYSSGDACRVTTSVTAVYYYNPDPIHGYRVEPGVWVVPQNQALQPFDFTDLIPQKGMVKYGVYKASILLIPRRIPAGQLFYKGVAITAKTGMNLIPEGKLANHLFKGVGKLADTPANRSLIQKLANSKALGVDLYGKSWYMGLDGAGKSIYTYTQNGIVKGAGYATMSAEQMILQYGLK